MQNEYIKIPQMLSLDEYYGKTSKIQRKTRIKKHQKLYTCDNCGKIISDKYFYEIYDVKNKESSFLDLECFMLFKKEQK